MGKEPEVLTDAVDLALVPSVGAGQGDQIEAASIDQQIATAHRFPRNLDQVREDLLSTVCIDPQTAEKCTYRLPARGDSGPIEGPTIRFAEAAVQAWTNLRISTRPLGETEDGQHIRAEAMVWDLESNVAEKCVVTRRITTKTGKRYNADGISNAYNAACSIAKRNAVLAVIPRLHVRAALVAAQKMELGDGKGLEERRKRALVKLAEQDSRITTALLVERLNRDAVASITIGDLATLNGWYNALKDNIATFDDLFGKEEDAVDATKAELLSRASQSEDADTTQPAPAPQPAAAPPDVGSAAPRVVADSPTTQEIARLHKQATSVGVSWDAVSNHFGRPVGSLRFSDVEGCESVGDLIIEIAGVIMSLRRSQ